MSTTTDNGGPAFPTVSASVHLPHHGMSLRDWLAGMALQGMLANPAIGFSMSAEAMSLAALSQADAMIAARNSSCKG